MAVNNARFVGIISDTHGLLRPEAIRALENSELILHVGDVGSKDVLERLEQIAPVIAVRGNVDSASWAEQLPRTAAIELQENLIWILHDLHDLDIDPARAGMAMVIYGHSHKPVQWTKKGAIYLNPGSAGPRRFQLPVSLVRADFRTTPPAIQFIDLLKGGEFTP